MLMKKVFFILLILLTIDIMLILSNNIMGLDNFIYDKIAMLKSDTLTSIMRFITNLASTRVIVGLNIIVIMLMLILKERNLGLTVIASITSVVCNNLIKIIVHRARPIGIALITEHFYSFPSGHSMIAMLFYGTISYYLYKKEVKYHKFMTIITAILIFLIGLSRIYLGVHYASDVIGGWLLGGILLIIITRIWEK